ncbi:Fc.00g012370.m01.CDS01 [Cosmosporella sp. VM-42]
MPAIDHRPHQKLTDLAGSELTPDDFNNWPNNYASWAQAGFCDWQLFPGPPRNEHDSPGVWTQLGFIPQYDNVNGELAYDLGAQVDRNAPSQHPCPPSESVSQPSQPSQVPSLSLYPQPEPKAVPIPKVSRREGKETSRRRPDLKASKHNTKLNEKAHDHDTDNATDDLPTKTHKKLQERNRLAARRFRIRKREDAVNLRFEELEMEQQHRKLSTSVDELTQEVYELKRQLLRHSDCNCAMIQEYIKIEAHRYIDGMDSQPRNSSSASSWRSFGVQDGTRMRHTDSLNEYPNMTGASRQGMTTGIHKKHMKQKRKCTVWAHTQLITAGSSGFEGSGPPDLGDLFNKRR